MSGKDLSHLLVPGRGQTKEFLAMDDLGFFDNLEIDEALIEAKRSGGGEVLAADTDCEGCKI